ncbi:MAG: YebC/PmpR family DNA-binding transcriptional regulator [Polyangiaceae bacterium]|nr:YebC/PmpR family DNA-binding transcriptional regulator [Polyangiaceae bacterium]
MSGHNRWSSIKHKKGAADAKRSKVWTKIIKEITVAARLGGGDPDGNPRLRRAVDLARGANMPADNITRAIKKGTGELEGVSYEELVYEGSAAGALFMIEILTDNRNRTAAEIRRVFEKGGGQLGATGAAAWAFDQKGLILLPASAATEEQLFELAVGAGAEDVELDGEQWRVITVREDLDTVRDALEKAGLPLEQASLAQIPKTPKEVDGDDARKLVSLFEALDDHDDVQNVFADFELSDSALAAME